MEEDIMDLINKFPAEPAKKILYIVYNFDMMDDAREKIAKVHGYDYLDNNVVICPLATRIENQTQYEVYIDPLVYKYLHSWND